MPHVRAVSMWFYPERTQDAYHFDWILNAEGSEQPFRFYLAYRNGILRHAGVGYIVKHDYGVLPPIRQAANPAAGVDFSPTTFLPYGHWYHLYVEPEAELRPEQFHVLAKANAREDLHARFAMVSLWNRALTDGEIDDLASGGVGPSLIDGSLLASYSAESADLSTGLIDDSSGRQPPAAIVSGHSQGGTLVSLTPPSVLHPPGASPTVPPLDSLVQLPRRAAMLSPRTYGAHCTIENCLDGDHVSSGSCGRSWSSLCHSRSGTDAYLSIDVGESAAIGYVAIYNRLDCCRDRLGQFQIWVSETAGQPTSGTKCAEADANSAHLIALPCSAYGRYVTLLLPGNNRVLNIQEMYLYNREDVTPLPSCIQQIGRRLTPHLPPLPPAPSPPPPVAACVEGSFDAGVWYDDRAVVERSERRPVEECAGWCTVQADANCQARAAILTGEALRCGYDSNASKCALFAAPNLTSHLLMGNMAQSSSPVDCQLRNKLATLCGDDDIENVDVSKFCRDAGVDPAQIDCETGDEWFTAMCIYDTCASGAGNATNGTQWNDLYTDAKDIDVAESKFRPPSAPPPPWPPSLPPGDWLEYYCTQCFDSQPIQRRLEEGQAHTTPVQRQSIKQRVRAYEQRGMRREEAWSAVREENDDRAAVGLDF